MDQMESNEVLSDDFNMIYHNISTIRNKNKRDKTNWRVQLQEWIMQQCEQF
jgi:hypothetical protein